MAQRLTHLTPLMSTSGITNIPNIIATPTSHATQPIVTFLVDNKGSKAVVN